LMQIASRRVHVLVRVPFSALPDAAIR